MDVTLLTLAASSTALVKAALSALESIKTKEAEKRITVQMDGRSVELEANAELVALLQKSVEQSSASTLADNPIALSRAAAGGELSYVRQGLSSEATAVVARVALAISAEDVIASARRRIDLVFRLNLGIAIALTVVLLGGIAGSLISSLVLGKSSWAAAFGGISAADILGIYAFKPLRVINRALVSSQRLDAVHLRLKEQLDSCRQLDTMEERIKCQTKTWEAIEKQLAALTEPEDHARTGRGNGRRAG